MSNNQSAAELVGNRLNERQGELEEAERRLRVFAGQHDDLAFNSNGQRQFDALVSERDNLRAQCGELAGLLGALYA